MVEKEIYVSNVSTHCQDFLKINKVAKIHISATVQYKQSPYDAFIKLYEFIMVFAWVYPIAFQNKKNRPCFIQASSG